MSEPYAPGSSAGGEQAVPLCVDLDGTLIRTDVLWESVAQLWRKPMVALKAAWALVREGKAALKAVLAGQVQIDPAALPYRQDVLAFLREQHAKGRELVLATATHRAVAERIAAHLGLFSKVLATEGTTNLSGERKRAALEGVFGRGGFDYIGDSRKDLPVFSAARSSLLVDPSPSLLGAASGASRIAGVFSETRSTLKVVARAIRIHQWAKNVLIVVPLLAAHMVMDLQAWAAAFVAFLAFGLVASATYLVNDLVDLRSDRLHPQKRHRPLASGQLSIQAGMLLALALGVLGFALSALYMGRGFAAHLAGYVALTLAYSFDLKRRLLVDVLALAVLYTLRILAGGVAIGVVVSEWLLMLSLFIFLSLAFLKRYIELSAAAGDSRISGRGYSRADLETVRAIGVSSGLVSVLVLSLYISSPAVSQLYRAPQALWLICPLLIYWIARIWFLAARGEVDHDPVVFALLDWRSYIVGGFGLAALLIAKVGIRGLYP